MSAETVKADLVAHIADNLPAWVTVTAVDDWPPAPALVAATDLLPVDEDKPWPCVLVAAESRDTAVRGGAIGDPLVAAEYRLRITAAVRTSKSKDVDDAVAGRDRLLLALRWLLLTSPAAGDDTTVLAAGMTETYEPAGLDPKSRPVSVGVLRCTARHVETIPDPAGVTADNAGVTLAVTDADGTLYTDAPAYDGHVVYDDTHAAYDGGTVWPPQQ